ncbi:MAG: tyrosine-type recombinase/integrase, partial [Acetatifactor sp.]|nr:tyrosine-type recombinase/integrase [Acetatifactor sp.]
MQNILKMRAVLEELPPFCKEFFRGIEQYTSARTRLAYAYDLRMFFEFLHEKNSACAKLNISEIPLEYLDMLHRQDIEEYLEYMSLYQKDGKNVINEERGKSRKLASLRSFYNYFFENEKIEKNPAALVPLPKQHEKEIIRLEPNEVAILLDQVEDGTKLTKKELEYHKKTKLRDVALITLLLGTGIRVSECVGLDIKDVDFEVYGIRI